MTIPNFQEIFWPLLQLAGDGKEHSLREAVEAMADHFALSKEERQHLLPSGRRATIASRVGWARTYLTKAGLLESPRRGYFRITPRGQEVLRHPPKTLNVNFLLEHYPEFGLFYRGNSRKSATTTKRGIASPPAETPQQTPEEIIEAAYRQIQEQLAAELLESIRSSSPAFFEQLVVDLLVKMGYGGSREDAGRAIGRQGDEGIDGVINEDRLGLDVIYIQAKRWENTVSRPEIQKFAGALQGKRAKKGIFITTSTFSQGARDYANRIDSKIILIDGQKLAQLMIEYDVGVTPIAVYELKRIDRDYFEEA